MKWLRGDRKEPITIPKARTFVERGLYTLIAPDATEPEKDTYVCRAINAYGQMDTSATVDVISSSAGEHGGKPAIFVSRPSKKSIDVIVGEDISISFRVSGIPKPRSKTSIKQLSLNFSYSLKLIVFIRNLLQNFLDWYSWLQCTLNQCIFA